MNPVPEGITVPEPMVWAFDEAIGKNIKEGEDPGPGTMAAEISQHLKPYGKRVVFPEEREFASAIPQSHRKGEKAFHVKAFRGSKDGKLRSFIGFTNQIMPNLIRLVTDLALH